MGGEWIETTIGEQATLQRGVDITKAEQRAGTVPVISSGGVSSFHDTAAASGPGVVLGRKGVVGSVYFIQSDYWPHDTTLWVKDFHGNNPRFVYYFFKWMAPRITTMDVGSANPTLNRNHVHPIEIRWPPLPEQRAIAHILGTLDDKIELNRRMNETLEAMARALFKSWFVDFDPVRAKMGAAPHPKSLSRGERDFLPSPPGRQAGFLPSPPGRGAGGEGTQPAIRANAPIPTQFLDFARQLRRQATDAESLLWRLLRGRQIANAKFRRQYSFPPYILDFYCHELKLAVELDGGQHNEEVGRRRDARRDEYLAGHGIRVLRFWNNDVLRETEAVLEAIYAAVVERSGGVPSPPAPLPGGEGSCGLPKPLADLFPDSFEDSELGEIPRGWRLETLASFASLNPESWTKDARPDTIEYVDLSNTKWGRIEAVTRYEQEDAPSRAQRVLRPGDTIIGTVRPGNGSYALVSDDGLTGSTGFAVLRPLRAEYREVVYLAATAAENIERLSHLADGAAYPAVRPEVVAATQVVKPTDEVAGRFSQVAGALLAKIAENDRESRTLAALRDTLLPKLISGELRIQHADKFLETVA